MIQPTDILPLFGAALIVGLSKSGIKGIVMFSVVILATAYGGKASTGVMVPMFIVGDVLAVRYYNRHAVWKYLWKLLPAAIVGVIIATLVGDRLNEVYFNKVIAGLVLFSVVMMLYLEKYPIKQEKVDHPAYGYSMGFLGGFCTMIGNTAGPILNMFLLSTGLPKNNFIGTAAWFFMLINLVKLPFHYFVWGTINPDSLWLNLWAAPVVIIGFFIGVRIVKMIPEKGFRYFVIVVTLIAAIRLMIA